MTRTIGFIVAPPYVAEYPARPRSDRVPVPPSGASSVNLDRVARYVDLELLESLEQVGLEVADPRPVLHIIVNIDDQREQPVVVAAAVRRPAAHGGIGAEGECAEVVDDLRQRIGYAPRAGIGHQPSVVEFGRQQDLIATFGHVS